VGFLGIGDEDYEGDGAMMLTCFGAVLENMNLALGYGEYEGIPLE